MNVGIPATNNLATALPRVLHSDGGGLAQLFVQMGANPAQAQQVLQKLPPQLKQRWEGMLAQGQQQQVVQELQQAMQGAQHAAAQQGAPTATGESPEADPESSTELQQAQAQSAQPQHIEQPAHTSTPNSGILGNITNWWNTHIPSGASKLMIALASLATAIFALRKGKGLFNKIGGDRNSKGNNNRNNTEQLNFWERRSNLGKVGLGVGAFFGLPLAGALAIGATNWYVNGFLKPVFSFVGSGLEVAGEAAKTATVETAHAVVEAAH